MRLVSIAALVVIHLAVLVLGVLVLAAPAVP